MSPINTIELFAFIFFHFIIIFAIVKRLISLFRVLKSKRITDSSSEITGELVWLGIVLLVAFLLIRFAAYDWFYKDFLM